MPVLYFGPVKNPLVRIILTVSSLCILGAVALVVVVQNAGRMR